MASRREANRELSRPAFLATLQSLFPELETRPHADTLNRLLTDIDGVHLEEAPVALVRRLIRNKKFRRYLIAQCYPSAIDGTQKLARNGQWQAEQWLERRRETAEGEPVQQYVCVLEANRVFHNGVTLPLLSEFLSYAEGDPDDQKQDCERNAFYRLAARLKAYFPRLPVLLLLDGLYPNGPLRALCHQYGWHFMIVFPDRCLPSVWSVLSKPSNRASLTTALAKRGADGGSGFGGSTTSPIATITLATSWWCMGSAVRKPGKPSTPTAVSLSISKPAMCGSPATGSSTTTSIPTVTSPLASAGVSRSVGRSRNARVTATSMPSPTIGMPGRATML
jgi:hypothetical protein